MSNISNTIFASILCYPYFLNLNIKNMKKINSCFKNQNIFLFLIITSVFCSSCDDDEMNPPTIISDFDVVTRECSDSIQFVPSMDDNASYQWDFGDGNSSTEKTPVHYYENSDIYEVVLTTTDERNPDNTNTSTESVEVCNRTFYKEFNTNFNTIEASRGFQVGDNYIAGVTNSFARTGLCSDAPLVEKSIPFENTLDYFLAFPDSDDNSVIFLGDRNYTNTGEKPVEVFKVDKDGTIINSKAFPKTGKKYITTDGIKTFLGNYLILSYGFNENESTSDEIRVIKVNKDLEIIWDESFPVFGVNAVTITELSNQDIVIGGSAWNNEITPSMTTPFLMKISGDGKTIEWSDFYGINKSRKIIDVIELDNNGEILAIGTYIDFPTSNVYVLKLDFSGGVIEDDKDLNFPYNDIIPINLLRVNDGIIISIFATLNNSSIPPVFGCVLQKYDSSFSNPIDDWTRAISGQKGCHIDKTSDEGIIVSGYNDDIGKGIILKLDCEGNVEM